MVFHELPKDAKYFSTLYSFNGQFHDLSYRYYNEQKIPLRWGNIIEMVKSTSTICPFDSSRYDNNNKADLRDIATKQFEQIQKYSDVYDIPHDAVGCLKVYMKIESDGITDKTAGVHIVFFNKDWEADETLIYVLYNSLTNELFENPFNDNDNYTHDCEEFEIRYGLK